MIVIIAWDAGPLRKRPSFRLSRESARSGLRRARESSVSDRWQDSMIGSLSFATSRRLDRAAAVAIMLLAGLGVSSAQTAPEKRITLPPPPADLPGHVNYLARQLYGVALDDSEPLTSQIEKLVLEHMGPWLSAHPPGSRIGRRDRASFPYDVQVRRELERVFGELQYPFDTRCAAFEKPFGTGELIGVGYSLGWDRVQSRQRCGIVPDQRRSRTAGRSDALCAVRRSSFSAL